MAQYLKNLDRLVIELEVGNMRIYKTLVKDPWKPVN